MGELIMSAFEWAILIAAGILFGIVVIAALLAYPFCRITQDEQSHIDFRESK